MALKAGPALNGGPLNEGSPVKESLFDHQDVPLRGSLPVPV